MARSIIFVSAVLAMIALVSAAPRPASVADVNVGYAGTGDVNVQKSLNHVVDLRGTHVHDIAQAIDVL